MHVFEALSFIVLSQETSWDTFSSISIDSDKPTYHSVGNDNQDNIVPPSESYNSQIGEDMTEKIAERYKENSCSKSVVFDYVISTNEHSWCLTVLVAGSSWVAECLAWKVDVAICVSSNKVEEVSQTSAFVCTEKSCFVAAGIFMASK